MIAIEDLEFAYPGGDFSLRVPQLEIARGSTVALTGASGCGKTTLIHLVAGILTPEKGRLEVGGLAVGRLSDARRREYRIRTVGLVFQEFELLEYLTVLDNILLPYRISRALRLDRTVRRRACSLATDVGLGGLLNRTPRRLSQGERQRVTLCRALVTRPELILADEPTGNLDPSNTAVVLDVLFRYVREREAPLVMVTHEHELLKRFACVHDMQELARAGDSMRNPPGEQGDGAGA